ncbi:MAG: hypothetical protein ACR2KX_11355 [Chitinophagaceae bacterium]
MAQFNIDIGNLTIDWFNKNMIGFDFSDNHFINKTASLLSKSEYFVAIHELLKQAKLGFTSIEHRIIKRANQQETLSADFIDFLINENVDEYQIQTKHNVFNGKNKVVKNIFFDLKKKT